MFKLSFTIALIVLAIAGLAQSPHGAGFKTDCAVCHTSKDWKVNRTTMSFDHNTTSFKLTGQHALTDCRSCHQTLKFQEAKQECTACHTDIHQNTLGPDCTRCHSTQAWIIPDTKTMHQMSRFPLMGNHAVADCAACHKSSSNFRYETLGIECLDCHKTEYLATTNPNHQSLFFPTNCIQCHDIKATSWNASSFQHNSFPLTGGHNITCVECHKGGNYQKISTDCVSCHQVQYNNAKGHVASKFPTNCTQCHNTNDWLQTTFDHSKSNFPLTGAHTSVDCATCHTAGFAGTPTECKSCHQSNYTNAQAPSHTKAGLPVDCKSCHTTTAWQPSSFNHTTTGFALTGGHAAIVQCSDCHLGSVTTAKPECVSCHQVQYNNAKGHVASKFPTDCTLCHNTTDWLKTSFDHSKTNFPLTGAHTSVDCAICHTAGYVGTSAECNSCHQANYTNAQTPSHTKAGLPVDCKSCHTTTAWQPSSFNHTTTGFALTGGHAAIVQCSDCHLGSVTSTKSECVSCHQVQYNNAKGHVASKFPTDCTLCHNSTDWLQTTFDHSKTNFPLTGAHSSVDCATCHTAGYVGTSAECNSCHQANYTNAQTPSHTKAGLPVDCKSCHTTTAWQPSSFNHSTTSFPLTGGHTVIVQCSDCHIGSVTTTRSECVSCHQAQYNNAKGHVASKFPTDCTLCHNTNNWLQTTFDHSKTNFPLTGAHTTLDCVSCHTTGYVGTSTACNSCHQTNYNQTTNPNHSTLGLSATCTDCHTTNPGWQPASFPIHNNYFVLSGAHLTIANDCAACHKGVYPNTPKTCYACHTTDYNNTTNPAHKTAQFPTDCATCHTVTAWVPSTFNHTAYFPIASGSRHNVSCAQCHTTPSNYAVFTCVTSSCHGNAHNQSQGSTGCYSCHPTGKAD